MKFISGKYYFVPAESLSLPLFKGLREKCPIIILYDIGGKYFKTMDGERVDISEGMECCLKDLIPLEEVYWIYDNGVKFRFIHLEYGILKEIRYKKDMRIVVNWKNTAFEWIWNSFWPGTNPWEYKAYEC